MARAEPTMIETGLAKRDTSKVSADTEKNEEILLAWCCKKKVRLVL